MGTITVALPEDDLAFLRDFSAAHGTSPEEFLARQARNLRENLQLPLPPTVIRATGIIASEIAAEEVYRAHVAEKHA